MFREMRRKRQLMTDADCAEMLERGTCGTLAVHGEDGYPYTVPLNYIYTDGKLYFHGAKTGHKVDAITANDKVSFCVVDLEQNVPEEFTTYFRSVVVFGRASVVEDDEEKRRAVDLLARQFSPNETKERREQAIQNEWRALCVLRVDVEHMTGKQAIELVKQK